MSSENLQLLVETAEESIARAESVAARDRSRPLYHFRAPGQWMDDPNGIIFHNGMYHMMYSLNPHSSEHRAGMVYKTQVRVWDPTHEDWTGGVTVWGHARSKDLVTWEHLPIALYPSIEKGEHFIWFGCTVINGDGKPMAIYTAIGADMRPEDSAQQWAAVGDADMLSWKKVPSNPILSSSLHGDVDIREWRDPFVFKEEGRVFMVLGGTTGQGINSEAVVTLYEALNPSYTSWAYRGIVFRHPRRGVPSAECPNLIKIDGKWVLLVSPHGAVEYFIGNLDLSSYKFTAETSGTVDHSTNFYATNVLFDDAGRCLMWGAVEGFSGTSGWNGCISLPRQLRVGEGNKLLQEVATELEALRASRVDVVASLHAQEVRSLRVLEEGEACEVKATIRHDPGAQMTLLFRSTKGAARVQLTKSSLAVGDRVFSVENCDRESRLYVFLDRTVLEIIVNSTICATVIVPLIEGAVEVSLEAGVSPLEAEVSVWQLRADHVFAKRSATNSV